MWKHYHWVPAIQQKAERSHSFVPIHHDIHLSESKGTDETTHIFKTAMHMQAPTCKLTLQLMIDFHSWLLHFIGEMPRKISAVC